MNAAQPRPTWKPAEKAKPTKSFSDYAKAEMKALRDRDRDMARGITWQPGEQNRTLPKRQRAVFDFIMENPGAETNEIIDAAELESRHVFNNLMHRLREKGYSFKMERDGYRVFYRVMP